MQLTTSQQMQTNFLTTNKHHLLKYTNGLIWCWWLFVISLVLASSTFRGFFLGTINIVNFVFWILALIFGVAVAFINGVLSSELKENSVFQEEQKRFFLGFFFPQMAFCNALWLKLKLSYLNSERENLLEKIKQKLKKLTLSVFVVWGIYCVLATSIYLPNALRILNIYQIPNLIALINNRLSEILPDGNRYFLGHSSFAFHYYEIVSRIPFLVFFIIPTITLITLGCYLFAYLRFINSNKLRKPLSTLSIVIMLTDVVGIIQWIIIDILLIWLNVPFVIFVIFWVIKLVLPLAMIGTFVSSLTIYKKVTSKEWLAIKEEQINLTTMNININMGEQSSKNMNSFENHESNERNSLQIYQQHSSMMSETKRKQSSLSYDARILLPKSPYNTKKTLFLIIFFSIISLILATIGSVFISFAIVQISIPFYVIGGVIWFFTFIFFIVTFVAIVRFIAEYFANK
ncbi:MPN085 family protein [Mycoplasmoides pneumoniae]